MPIHPLPEASKAQLSSGLALLDPVSIVKELLDNALDAHANCISIDVALNATDYIQVRDNGVGIAPEDRALLGRRYCTSKIRTLDDVHRLGGKSLGFRGEALSSLVAVAARVDVTTRIEGEMVGVKIPLHETTKENWTLISHPQGTTVRATHVFHSLPVRKQTMQKDSAKILAKISHLVHAYVFARPSVRLSFKVPQSKSTKLNFTFAPAVSVMDVASKVFGVDIASQCTTSGFAEDGFQIQMTHPSVSADAAKFAGLGHFISIDGRPVSARAGVLREILSKYRGIFRKFFPSAPDARDPFLCLNVDCPAGSYDPNVEPLKDDVIFADPDGFVSAICRCFEQIYPPEVPNAPILAEPTTADDLCTPATLNIDSMTDDRVDCLDEQDCATPAVGRRTPSSQMAFTVPVQRMTPGNRLSPILQPMASSSRTNAPANREAIVGTQRQLLTPAPSSSPRACLDIEQMTLGPVGPSLNQLCLHRGDTGAQDGRFPAHQRRAQPSLVPRNGVAPSTRNAVNAKRQGNQRHKASSALFNAAVPPRAAARTVEVPDSLATRPVRTLSRAHPTTGVRRLQLLLPGEEITAAARCSTFAKAHMSVPWAVLSETSDVAHLPLLCRGNATMWSMVLSNLIDIKYKRSVSCAQLRDHVKHELLHAQVLRT